MVIEYSVPRISLISSSSKIILKNRCFLYFVNDDPHISPQSMNVLGVTITTETSVINTILENVTELVIITEVKLIKKFFHAVFENCHGKKWLKLKVYIVNLKRMAHCKQSLSFSSCVPLC